MPVPDKSDMHAFVRIDEWQEITRTDHYRYVKRLERDGTILRTRISMGSGHAFSNAVWPWVWRHQLGLSSEGQFWTALRDREPVDRTPPAVDAPAVPTKPAWLVEYLVFRAGLDEHEVLAMTEDAAMAAYERHIQAPPG